MGACRKYGAQQQPRKCQGTCPRHRKSGWDGGTARGSKPNPTSLSEGKLLGARSRVYKTCRGRQREGTTTLEALDWIHTVH